MTTGPIAGYLNRARIARLAKARAMEEQREAWRKGRDRAENAPVETAPFPAGTRMAPAA